jgi:hypothetical protein
MAGLHCFIFQLKEITMKNAMLFCIALLFSVSANAATLSLSTVGSSGATQEISLNNNSTVLAGGTVANSGTWESLFDVKTDVDTPVKVEWSFNPSGSLDNAQLAFGEVSGPGGFYLGGGPTIFNITNDFIFTAILTAGSFFGVDILNATSGVLKYDLSISAVPVPAALWLFAPALMGFFGLRRKALKTAAA